MIVEIIDVESKGLTVLLQDGSTGFVPRKELSWSRERFNPTRKFREGERINVTELSRTAESDGRMFSIKRVRPDPWITSGSRYSVGQNALAKVISIFEEAIFVELEEGVCGRVRIKELGPRNIRCSSQGISLGDTIRVRITEVNNEHNNFECSNTIALEEIGNSFSLNDKSEDCSNVTHKNKPLDETFDTGPINVLLIDDDEPFCISTKRVFDLAGHRLEYSNDPEKGITLAINGAYDIVIIDLVMPKLHGFEVYRRIHDIDPKIQMAIFTGEDTISVAGFTELSPKPLVLHKPFEVSDVEAACFNKARTAGQLVPETRKQTARTTSPVDYGVQNLNSDEFVVNRIRGVLEKLDHTLYGVFKWLQSDQRLIYLDGQGFRFGANKEQMERLFFYSRLRNTAEHQEVISVSSVSDTTESFKRSLKNIFPFADYFESLYVAPIVVQGHTRYVVLYGHVMPNQISASVHQLIADKHIVIAADLSVRETYKQVEMMQRLALRGELTASLAHEIRNRLHILSMNMKSLKKLGPRAVHKLRQAKSLVPEELGELNEILDESQTALDKISDVVTSFSEDIAEKGSVDFDLAQLVRSVGSRLKLMAEKERVPIRFHGKEQCIVAGSPSRLGQVVENLILNAIQHTSGFRKKYGNVSVVYGNEESTNTYYVEVSDNGEGIHAKDFGRIFEMGFTTKATGSGVGLALCSAAMRSLGGTVFVKQSVLFEGTTMRIEWQKK